ncbi:tetratricopeptide repeat protein [Yoonia algicola]|uniref:Tetratricopeptide repeat protein n=1 Tax=Yoonia algicola TaxID=3137368 RepID=A0AAN0M678_9RHOB
MRYFLRVCLIFLSLTALAACKTNEEKAEDFYQSGLTLLAAGDLDRAAIQFLNVFQHDGFHQDARRKLAEVRLEQGDIGAAYSQYLRLVEQYPDTPDVRITLARIAIDISNWDEARRHGQAAIALAPDDQDAQSIAVALAYRDATQNNDTKARAQAAMRARELLDVNPDDKVARRVVIDDLMRSDTPRDALSEIDRALTSDPENYVYHTARLQVLTQIEDMPNVGRQLRRMVALFPNDPNLTQSLIGWYFAQDDLAGAEQYLRERAGEDTGPIEGHIAVVQFLQGTQGADAAQQELDRLAAANAGTANADVYQTLSAAIRFEAGDQDTAIATFEAVLSQAEPSDQTRQIRNTYARLLITTGDETAARTQVDTILLEDETNVDALKLRAAWLIADDRAGEAIQSLRQALGQQPRDPETLTLMAQAHQREGNRALAGERLSLAVDVTNSAPDEAIRYANFLLEDGRTAAARAVLTDARATSPNNVAIMTNLASILLSEGAWIEAQGVANTLRAIENTQAQQAATSLQAALLLGQNRIEDSLTFLQAEIEQGNGDIEAVMQLVQIHLLAGDLDTARSTLDQALASSPDDINLQMLNASLFAMAGDFETSEAAFRRMITDFPQSEGPILRLYNLLVATDRPTKADAVLDTGLNALPNSLNLRWLSATRHEERGDIDGAIAIYEAMYAENSDSLVIANNLASLIATHKDDDASLMRAASIAKRLRDLGVPAFQDTYGWIAYRQGNLDEALAYLVPAAAGLPNDPLTQYHLGMTYADLGQTEKATVQLTRALVLAGDQSLPQFDIARAKLHELGQ